MGYNSNPLFFWPRSKTRKKGHKKHKKEVEKVKKLTEIDEVADKAFTEAWDLLDNDDGSLSFYSLGFFSNPRARDHQSCPAVSRFKETSDQGDAKRRCRGPQRSKRNGHKGQFTPGPCLCSHGSLAHH